MRERASIGIAILGMLAGPAGLHGQEGGGWVGQRVVTRPATVLKIGRKVVDDLKNAKAGLPYREESGASGAVRAETGREVSAEQAEATMSGLFKADPHVTPSSSRVDEPAAPPEGPPHIVAHVGAEVITLDELKDAVKHRLRVAKLPGGYMPTREEVKLLTTQVLDVLIEQSFITQEARKELKNTAQLKLIMAFADKTWREEELPPLLREMGVKDASELGDKLAAQGRSLDRIRESYTRDFLARAYVETKLKDKVNPSDAEVRAYYEAHRQELAPFAEAESEVRRIVREQNGVRECNALIDAIRRQTVITTIFDGDEAFP